MKWVHKASVTLAARYLAVIMAISLFFSLTVYQLSLQEIDRGLRRPGSALDSLQDGVLGREFNQDLTDNLRQQLQIGREQQYNLARDRVMQRLVATNLVILVGAGFLSYYLARRTLRPIEEAHEAQSRFTADASHELRTPVAAMQAEIEVALMDAKLSLPQAKAQLRSNLEELSKLTALTDGLLRLARMENGDLPVEPVNLESVLQAAVSRVLPQAEQKQMLMNVPDGLTVTVMGDADSLTELFVILMDNAVKYSPVKSEVVVKVETERRMVMIRVVDRGPGIRATELPHIFERFYRADAARSKQTTPGYGLGLAIARTIAEAHQGKMTVASKPGRGSVFSVSLPLS